MIKVSISGVATTQPKRLLGFIRIKKTTHKIDEEIELGGGLGAIRIVDVGPFEIVAEVVSGKLELTARLGSTKGPVLATLGRWTVTGSKRTDRVQISFSGCQVDLNVSIIHP